MSTVIVNNVTFGARSSYNSVVLTLRRRNDELRRFGTIPGRWHDDNNKYRLNNNGHGHNDEDNGAKHGFASCYMTLWVNFGCTYTSEPRAFFATCTTTGLLRPARARVLKPHPSIKSCTVPTRVYRYTCARDFRQTVNNRLYTATGPGPERYCARGPTDGINLRGRKFRRPGGGREGLGFAGERLIGRRIKTRRGSRRDRSVAGNRFSGFRRGDPERENPARAKFLFFSCAPPPIPRPPPPDGTKRTRDRTDTTYACTIIYIRARAFGADLRLPRMGIDNSNYEPRRNNDRSPPGGYDNNILWSCAAKKENKYPRV